MLAFCYLLVAAVSSLAGSASTGGTIGKLLVKLNNTLQTGVSDTHKSVDKLLTLGDETVSSVAGLVSSGSDQISTLGINGMDMGGTLSKQGINIMQDTVHGMMSVANEIPIVGKIVSVPNSIMSKVVNTSLDIGRGSVDALIGAGEATAAVANAMTGAFTNSAASALSTITNKISRANDKGSELISKEISKGIKRTSEVIQKVGEMLHRTGDEITRGSTLPGSSSGPHPFREVQIKYY